MHPSPGRMSVGRIGSRSVETRLGSWCNHRLFRRRNSHRKPALEDYARRFREMSPITYRIVKEARLET